MDQDQNEGNQSPKQQVAERVRQATNVLVTVRSNPSVDELAAAIGLTLMLNKLDKHATAVFSGQVPSTLEFLKPEETIETNTDSLRDFIVSLDKSKADKLRYKVEENVVKIFITPYRTSITQDDLEFTQGDFNVDVVLALGVTQREELDQAITAHGRILHDATVVTVIAGQKDSDLGNINWQDAAASSLSEMLVSISEALQGGLIDSQIATAFLTGIVAETERFSNPKTTPKVMTMAAQLMAAGANQQLIANELQKDVPLQQPPPMGTEAPQEIPHDKTDEAGSLDIDHNEANQQASSSPQPKPQEAGNAPAEKSETSEFLPPLPPSEQSQSVDPLVQDLNNPVTDTQEGYKEQSADEPSMELPSLESQPAQAPVDNSSNIHIDHEGNITKPSVSPKHKRLEPIREEELSSPGFEVPKQSEGEQLPDNYQPAPEVLQPTEQPTAPAAPEAPEPPTAPAAPEAPEPPKIKPDINGNKSKFIPMPEIPEDEAPDILPDNTTLEEIEKSVDSPHQHMQDMPRQSSQSVNQQTAPGVDDVGTARDAVNQAINTADFNPANQARSDVGSQSFGDLHPGDNQRDNMVEPSNQPPQPEGPPPPPVPPPFTGQ